MEFFFPPKMLDMLENQAMITTLYVHVSVSAPTKVYKIILSYMIVGFYHITIWKKIIWNFIEIL